MNKNQIIEKLEEFEIEFDKNLTNKQLIELLNQSPKYQEYLKQEQEKEDKEAEEKAKKEAEEKERKEAEAKEKAEEKAKNKIKKEGKLDKQRLMRGQEKMLAKINAEPKIKIFVPKEKSESKGAFTTVQINGYTWQIKKGVYVELPKPVADILMESLEQTEEAHRKAKEALSSDERMEFDNSQN